MLVMCLNPPGGLAVPCLGSTSLYYTGGEDSEQGDISVLW